MLKGKRGPRPTAVKLKKRNTAETPNSGNRELPGVETDSRKIVAIEDAYERVLAANKKIEEGHTDREDADKALVKVMNKHGFDQDNPMYYRDPWGGVVLTYDEIPDEPEVHAKYIKPNKKKATKKKE